MIVAVLNKNTEISFYHFRKVWEKKTRIPVIHCGAHTGEEAQTYFDLNMFPVYWIEAAPGVFDELRQNVYRYPLNEAIEAALWNESGRTLDIYVSSDSHSSSLLAPLNILKVSKEAKTSQRIKVQTKTLDELNFRFFKDGLLILDVQGAEMKVLQGSQQILGNSKWIYCEVSKTEMYKNCAKWSEIQQHLTSKGFKLVDWQYDEEQDWGNALYRKGRGRLLDPMRRKQRAILHRKSWDSITEFQAKW
jgi:FkbM family methyltransferase